MGNHDWVDKEKAILVELYHDYGYKRVRNALKKAGYTRTPNAIIKKAMHMGINRKIDYLWSVPEVAETLEITESCVRWTLLADRDKLRPKRKGPLVFLDTKGFEYIREKYTSVNIDDYVGTGGLAKQLHLSRKTITRWVHEDRFPTIKVRGKRYIPKDVVAKIVEWFTVTGNGRMNWESFPLEEGYLPIDVYAKQIYLTRKGVYNRIKRGTLEGKYVVKEGSKRGRWLVKV
jgi:excisionase family DNA binding protein